jgi:hypothetical protein
MNNDGLHLLDIFRDWECPPGIRLLMGLLNYDPSSRLTAAEALLADYFTTPVGCTPDILLSQHFVAFRNKYTISFPFSPDDE